MSEALVKRTIIVSFVISCIVSIVVSLVFLMGFDVNVFIIAFFAIAYVILILCGIMYADTDDLFEDDPLFM